MSRVDIYSFYGTEEITLRLAGTACVYLGNMVQSGKEKSTPCSSHLSDHACINTTTEQQLEGRTTGREAPYSSYLLFLLRGHVAHNTHLG